MAGITRIRAKGRRESGNFVALPFSVLDHPNFIKLSHKGKGLLLDLCSQLRFKKDGSANNGDLCATWSMMKARGWKSKESLRFALNELTHYGFILMTRQGHRRKCSLYAVTFLAIDECGGKLDSAIKPTITPPSIWKDTKPLWRPPKRVK